MEEGMQESKETAYFSGILDKALPELPADAPIVLFFDGVGVTRDRENYDLTDPAYGDAMLLSAQRMCGGVPHTCYQVSDEISIILPDIRAFSSRINAHYLTHDEVCGLAVQQFSDEFSGIYGKKTRFHVRAHAIGPDDCERYIAWRREYTKLAVYTYFAIREGIWNGACHGYGKKEVLSLIMRRGLYGKLIKNRRYTEGTLVVSQRARTG